MGLNPRYDATWANLRPMLPEARVQALAILQRPPDRLVEGLRHRHETNGLAGLDNEALEEVRLCLLADLLLVTAMMQVNGDGNDRR